MYAIRYRDEHNRLLYVADPHNPRKPFSTGFRPTAERVKEEFEEDYGFAEIVELAPHVLYLTR